MDQEALQASIDALRKARQKLYDATKGDSCSAELHAFFDRVGCEILLLAELLEDQRSFVCRKGYR